MTTLNQIKQEQLQARKNKESVKATLLTTFIGEVQSKITALPIEQRTEQKELEIIASCVKFFLAKNREAQGLVSDPEKLNLLVQEEAILKPYEPSRLSADELRQIIQSNFPEITAKNKGPIVGFLKKNYGASVDGVLAQQVITQLMQ